MQITFVGEGAVDQGGSLLDKFRQGLNTFEFLDMVEANPSLWKPYFVHSDNDLTPTTCKINKDVGVPNLDQVPPLPSYSVCVFACVRACMYACVCVRVRVHVHVYVFVLTFGYTTLCVYLRIHQSTFDGEVLREGFSSHSGHTIMPT